MRKPRDGEIWRTSNGFVVMLFDTYDDIRFKEAKVLYPKFDLCSGAVARRDDQGRYSYKEGDFDPDLDLIELIFSPFEDEDDWSDE